MLAGLRKLAAFFLISSNSRAFSMAMTACVGEALHHLDLSVGKGNRLFPANGWPSR